ncbi:hypothetical protein HN592_05180 [Candidatus Woesearchaeota archaeon]|jgi:hypothetical protein|nr:hypothetical protein [Candidatus Woesearchaeota archaeon]MBT4367778.1 hypothetical protein [Candidatus Woesearchaeota archaeon]MBT4712266.1 hypothetical protein [Candidatus Woesearchaeota archaeon]MBT6638814.1 hypothetical protein [Candidatus Woesearchaeota archaeon]MBT7134458.1 hypothetical protein [Candidatus Woesearchaeota archaeon]
MLKIIIEKKAKYTLCALFVILVSFIALNSLSSSSLTPPFYNSLSQVTKSSFDFMSVDADNNGIIDESEKAFKVQMANIDNVPGLCLENQLLTGFDSSGNPICTYVDFECEYVAATTRNKCWIEMKR